MTKRFWVLVSVTVILSPYVYGQEVRRSENRLIEEVVVTAQKREENLSDVPISISAFSAERLDALGVVTAKDLTQVTPGLQYDEVASFSVIFLRGVGTDVFIPTADLSVATYIDGIYFPFANSLAQDLGALERIEVLKGPQGTLFGRNSTGGAISIITKSPSEEPEFSAQYSYGSFNESKLRLYGSGALSEAVFASVSLIYNTGESYYEFTDDSPLQDVIDTRNTGVQAKLKWQPNDKFDLLLSANKVQLQSAGTSLFIESDPKPLGRLLGAEADRGDPYEVAMSTEPFNYTNNNVVSTTANYYAEAFDVKWLTSYQYITTDSQNDYDSSAVDLVTFRSSNLFSHVFTTELQFISNDNSWMADRLSWIAGLYYINSRGGFDPVDVAVANRTLAGLTSQEGISDALGLSQNLLNTLSDILAPLGDTLPELAGLPSAVGVPSEVAARISAYVDTSSPSLFFQSTYDISSKLALTVGARYQQETRELVKSAAGLANDDGSTTVLFNYDPREADVENISPKLTVDYKPTDNSLVYMTWAKGFKSGTFNSVNIVSEPEFVEPEEVVSYELGTKSQFLDGRLRVNAALFRNEIEDLQVQFVSLLSGGIVSLENAGKSSIDGVDLDLQWSASDSLVFTLGASYLDSTFDEYLSGRGFGPETGIYSQGLDFSGNTPPRSPKYTANLGVLYSKDIGDGNLELAADTYYNDGYFYDNQNQVMQESYQLYNARVSYIFYPHNLRVTLYGKNLSDEPYRLYRLVTDFGVGDTLAAPRNFGIRFNYDI